jgi:precorrin-6Y C5,15-methyltransferase (decarboxylating)
MDKILLFAGTTEGRQLAEYLNRYEIETHVCVATEYGEKLMVEGEFLHIRAGRMTDEEMAEMMQKEGFTLTVDATHPYAALVSENIRKACERTGTEYIRLMRASLGESGSCTCVASVKEAVEFLKHTRGNILVTTGSKELHLFTELPGYQERVYARVLSTPEVAASCKKLGFEGKHLICMQGPFGEDLNTAMLRHVDAAWMVTKESGKNGGYEEKLRAAEKAGAKVVLVGRPAEAVQGMSEMEVRAFLCRRLGLTVKHKISLIGIGMGNPENMTLEAKHACEEAELLIGAGRMLAAADTSGKAVLTAYKAEEIRDYVYSHPEYEKAAVLLSGDVGFYSGAKKLFQMFEGEEVRVYSGISSLVYLCGKLHTSWEDAKLVSLHGREQNVIAAVKNYRKVFALIGKKDGVRELCEKLMDYGMGEVQISVGEELSYAGERITTGKAAELAEREFSPLCVVLIRNEKAEKTVVHGIRDEEFLRAKVPMTKEEVRSVSLSKLGLAEDAVIYDVGAGTGSVSIEMALRAVDGRVYAVEKKPEAVELLRKNKKKFGTDNLKILEGPAPEILADLPAPTHAFIGGSSGNLMEILEVILKKNPKARIVINAIALETVAEAMRCIRTLPVTDVDIVTLAAGKSKEVGSYHMMMGQNPVYIFSFTGGAG